MSSILRRLPVCAPVLLSGLLLAAAPVASDSSMLPPWPYAPQHAVSRLAGPYVLWSIAERNGKPVRIECAVQLTDDDVDYTRFVNGSGPATNADLFFAAESPGEYIMHRARLQSARDRDQVGRRLDGRVRRLAPYPSGAGGADGLSPGMVAGEYALAGGKVYLTALRAPSKAGPEVASPLGGPGFGYEATIPKGWLASLNPASDPGAASLMVAWPGSPAPDPFGGASSSLSAGQAACTVSRMPTMSGGGLESVGTQDEVNARARKAAAEPGGICSYPERAPTLKTEAVERGDIEGVQRTWTGPAGPDALVWIELEWTTPAFQISASCAAGATLDAPLGQAIYSFIAALVPDTR